MSSRPKRISTATFKSRCLSVIDEVNRTREPVIVTKHGRAVARLEPAERRHAMKLRGSVTFHGDIIEPILGDWDIEQ